MSFILVITIYLGLLLGAVFTIPDVSELLEVALFWAAGLLVYVPLAYFVFLHSTHPEDRG